MITKILVGCFSFFLSIFTILVTIMLFLNIIYASCPIIVSAFLIIICIILLAAGLFFVYSSIDIVTDYRIKEIFIDICNNINMFIHKKTNT